MAESWRSGKTEHRADLDQQGIVAIDLVVVNLYPFRETIAKADVSWDEAIENIDIGGPAMGAPLPKITRM